MPTQIKSFFRQNPVFTREEFRQSIGGGIKSENTLKNILAHHLKQGHIVRIKRGLFASIPYGADPVSFPINPFLIASHLAQDSVIAYHAALSFYGTVYSSSYRITYLTHTKTKPLQFRDMVYQPSYFPSGLIAQGKSHIYVNQEESQGMDICVTSKERTFIDVLDRPLLSGGWEEVWRSLAMMNYLNIDHVIDYVKLLGVAMTAAKVGFYLEQRKLELGVTNKQLKELQQYRPKSACYLEINKRNLCQLVPQWNLLVPAALLNENWEELLQWEPKE